MDLLRFYLENVTEADYHYRFKRFIEDNAKSASGAQDDMRIDNGSFVVFDQEEAIEKFRELCQPDRSYGPEEKSWFYLVCYYLHKNGYAIKQFPRVLARPPENPSRFSYDEIRGKLIAQGKADRGIVRYAERRELISKLSFDRGENHIDPGDDLNKKLIEVSTRQAPFVDMDIDEKLAEIANLIENLLKTGKSFAKLDYDLVCLGYISDETVTSYRKRLQCFRHAHAKALGERRAFSTEQKNFLIDYGVTIAKAIYNLLAMDGEDR